MSTEKKVKAIEMPEGFTSRVSFRTSNGVWTQQKQAVSNALKSLKGTEYNGGKIVNKSDLQAALKDINDKAAESGNPKHAYNIVAGFARAGKVLENSDGTEVYIAPELLA